MFSINVELDQLTDIWDIEAIH